MNFNITNIILQINPIASCLLSLITTIVTLLCCNILTLQSIEYVEHIKYTTKN